MRARRGGGRVAVSLRTLLALPSSNRFPSETSMLVRVPTLKSVLDPKPRKGGGSTHLLHPQPALWPHDSARPAPQKLDHSGQQCGVALEGRKEEHEVSGMQAALPPQPE